MTDIIIQKLIINRIPFNKKFKKDNVLLIPGGVIKIKNMQSIKNNADIELTIKQMQHLESKYKHLGSIYLYMDNINMENYHTFYNVVSPHINSIICYTTEQIMIGDYCYAIKMCGAIWTLITLFEVYYPIFQNKPILITNETYKRSIIIMTDEELELLHKYNIQLVDILDNMQNQLCYITQNTFDDRELFTFVIKYVPLNGGNRSPYRVIEGLTTICPNCQHIVYVDNMIIRKHKNNFGFCL
jgi:hypothetical protein